MVLIVLALRFIRSTFPRACLVPTLIAGFIVPQLTVKQSQKARAGAIAMRVAQGSSHLYGHETRRRHQLASAALHRPEIQPVCTTSTRM